jgi:hypothetical protein
MHALKSSTLAHRIVRSRAGSLLAAALLTLTARTAAAACNEVNSQTILPPDRSDASTVTFVTVYRKCNAPTFFKQCVASFHPLSTWSEANKCHALRDAVMNSPDCQALQFAVKAPDNCPFAPLGNNSFTVVDNDANPDCANFELSLGISNDPNQFSQTGAGQDIPDYEAELIKPACGVEPGGAPLQNQITVGGAATGVAIVSGQPASVQAFVSTSSGLKNAKVQTTAGMPASAVVSQLVQKLQALGVNAAPVTGESGIPADVAARMLRVTQPSQGTPVGVAIQTSDTGLTTASHTGTAAGLKSLSLQTNLCAVNPAACNLAGDRTCTLSGAMKLRLHPQAPLLDYELVGNYIELGPCVTAAPSPSRLMMSFAPALAGPQPVPWVVASLFQTMGNNECSDVFANKGDKGRVVTDFGPCGAIVDELEVISTNPYKISHHLSGTLDLAGTPAADFSSASRDADVIFTSNAVTGGVAIKATLPSGAVATLCQGTVSGTFSSLHATVPLPARRIGRASFNELDAATGQTVGTRTRVVGVVGGNPVPAMSPTGALVLAAILLGMGALLMSRRRRAPTGTPHEGS